MVKFSMSSLVTKFQEEVLEGTRIFLNTVYDRCKKAFMPKPAGFIPSFSIQYYVVTDRRRDTRQQHTSKIALA